MKSIRYLAKSLLLTLALVSGSATIAQTSEQSQAAYERKDYKAAFTGFKRLAEQGDASAQFNLGLMYAKGTGVPKDDQQALAWYRKAAEQGDARAQVSLGFMYTTGTGVPKDDQQALAWYRKAVEQGNAAGQQALGMMYANGSGVPKNEELAYFWWLLSSAQGNGSAVKNRDIVEKNLTPQQRENAQESARNWKPK